MTQDTLKRVQFRPDAEYLVKARDYRVTETFSMRDTRYQDVDELLRGEWGYTLPGDNTIVEQPMVMNLGLAFVNDVSRLTTEQTPVYKTPAFSDKKEDLDNAQVREVVAETYWTEGRGDLLVPQQAIDLAVCGAAYTVCWVDENDVYPRFARVDPRHAYPTIRNGIMHDLLVIHVFPAEVADVMFPGHGILIDAGNKTLKSEVEVWEYYSTGYAIRAVAHLNTAGRTDPSLLKTIESRDYDIDCPPAAFTQIPSHDGAIRGMLDQLGHSLKAKNKIASLMTKYTEHKVFAPWEEKGVLNPQDTPGPNTVYHHDPNAPAETFIRRVDPAGSDPSLFGLMNMLDLDQRGGIGYPASRQGEVGQSIASAAFVESTQGQLSSIVKNIQMHEADLRSQTLEIMAKLDVAHMDFSKPLVRAVGKKKTYIPSKTVGDRTRIIVQYGAGAGLSRQNADNRVLNLLGARLIDRGSARDNIEFLRDRSDIQDKIEMENAEDALQQLFWPDPSVPIDVKFRVKSAMSNTGLNLSEAWDQVKEELEKEAQAQQQQDQLAAQQAGQQPGVAQLPQQQVDPTAASDQALALEKGAAVSEPADIELPSAPLEQIFVAG
jgi:hypothetical protein